MSVGSRYRMRWLWYRYIISVCNVYQTLRDEVSVSGLSRANSESEMLYCMRIDGYYL
jgi:hypothetical protein